MMSSSLRLPQRIINVLLARTIFTWRQRSLSKTHKKKLLERYIEDGGTSEREREQRDLLIYDMMHESKFFGFKLSSTLAEQQRNALNRLLLFGAPETWSRFSNYSALIVPLFVLSFSVHSDDGVDDDDERARSKKKPSTSEEYFCGWDEGEHKNNDSFKLVFLVCCTRLCAYFSGAWTREYFAVCNFHRATFNALTAKKNHLIFIFFSSRT